jgi:hypothetical protein
MALPTGPAVITDDVDVFHIPPADSKIRCATHLATAEAAAGAEAEPRVP